MAWRSFSSIFIFLSSSPSRSSTLQGPFPRPGVPLAGGLGPGAAGGAGRRPPGGPGAGGEEPLLEGEAGVLGALTGGLPPLFPLLLVAAVAPADVSVRFKAAGPISACRDKTGQNKWLEKNLY